MSLGTGILSQMDLTPEAELLIHTFYCPFVKKKKKKLSSLHDLKSVGNHFI